MVARVLAVAAHERVNRDRIIQIFAHALNDDEPDEDEGNEEDQGDDEPEDRLAELVTDADEAEAILAGSSPPVPPPALAPATDYITPAFTQAVEKLRELSTKLLAKLKMLPQNRTWQWR